MGATLPVQDCRQGRAECRQGRVIDIGGFASIQARGEDGLKADPSLPLDADVHLAQPTQQRSGTMEAEGESDPPPPFCGVEVRPQIATMQPDPYRDRPVHKPESGQGGPELGPDA